MIGDVMSIIGMLMWRFACLYMCVYLCAAKTGFKVLCIGIFVST